MNELEINLPHKEVDAANQAAFPGVTNEQYLFALIHSLANRMQTMGDGLYTEMTWKQWFALLGVVSFEKAPGIMEVAERIGTSQQNLKQLLLKLSKAGYVVLSRDPRDQRRTVIHATDKTMEFETKYSEATTLIMRDLFAGIDPKNLLSTAHTLMKMEENLLAIQRQGRKTE